MKKWTDIQAGTINAAEQRLWVALGENAGDVATRMNNDPAFVTNVARFMVNGGYEATTSQKNAKKIMGKNYHGPEVAIKHFGVSFSKQDLAYLADVPFSEETLRACKKTHILVAVPALSIIEIRTQTKQKLFYSQDWYDKQQFAHQKGTIGWRLIRKTPVENSTSKNWEEQLALLGKEEEAPSAQVMVYTIIGHFLVTGERLFENVYVRCSDLDSDGVRVNVGGFDQHGLIVSSDWDDRRSGLLGLASGRKSDS